jgi:hypothetical protein
MARIVRKMRRWMAWLMGLLAAPFVAAGCGDKDKAQPAGEGQKTGEKTSADKPAAGKAGDLKDSADWKVIEDAWAFGTPMARNGESTTKQREESDGKFKAANDAAQRLVAAGLISAAEAGLLAVEAEKIKTEIYLNPPTDYNAKCYESMEFIPAANSMGHLTARLPLLEKVTASGKVTPDVVEKILDSISADMAILSNEKELAKLENDQKRAEAAKTRDAVREQMRRIGALLERM